MKVRVYLYAIFKYVVQISATKITFADIEGKWEV